MPALGRCPQCGAELPVVVPEGSCFRCLLAAGVEHLSGDATPPDEISASSLESTQEDARRRHRGSHPPMKPSFRRPSATPFAISVATN